MRKIARPTLDRASQASLTKLSDQVRKAKEPKVEAVRLWDVKSKSAFQRIRKALETMAAGRARCMYCEDSFGTDIEHFYPKARYPKRAYRWDNYLLACSHCNSNLKRERFPFANRRPALIDPTAEDPADSLAFLPTSGELAPKGVKGQPSIDVFGLNDSAAPRKLPQARRSAFLTLQLLLEDYDAKIAARDPAGAAFVKQAIQDQPFPAVLGWLLQIASVPGADQTLRPGIPSLLTKHGVATW